MTLEAIEWRRHVGDDLFNHRRDQRLAFVQQVSVEPVELCCLTQLKSCGEAPGEALQRCDQALSPQGVTGPT